MGLLVMRAFWPIKNDGSAEGLLGLAIFLSFALHVANTLYWQVFGQLAIHYEWASVAALRFWGDWLDLIFKGGAALTAYLHLKALWKKMPDESRREWAVWEIPWYPARRTCLCKLFGRDQ